MNYLRIFVLSTAVILPRLNRKAENVTETRIKLFTKAKKAFGLQKESSSDVFFKDTMFLRENFLFNTNMLSVIQNLYFTMYKRRKPE